MKKFHSALFDFCLKIKYPFLLITILHVSILDL